MTALSQETPTSGGQQNDFQLWLVFFAGLIALLVVRIVALYVNATDLFFDEAQYWFWSENLEFGYYSKPAMIAGIIRTASEVCGQSEFCIRLPSPLIHTATSLVICFIAREIYDLKTGVVAGLVYATLPAVSLSSSLISTDVPLLLFWAIALLAFIKMLNGVASWWVLVFALAIGFGLNSKYAMVWFVLCAGIYFFITPGQRALLRKPWFYAAIAVGVAMLVPNILWNASNQFSTLSHTADNANWGGPLMHPHKALEFFLAQFGVFGPILFATLLIICWRAWREGLTATDRLLLAFTLPVLIAITLQAFVSRAHANWAAVSYVAGTVLVAATFLRRQSWGWLTASFALHIAIIIVLIAGTSFAGQFSWPGNGPGPLARVLGWKDLSRATENKIAKARANGRPFVAVLSDKRSIAAQLLYYMRNSSTPILAWREGAARDHFQLVRQYKGSPADDSVLLVSAYGDMSPALKAFEHVEKLSPGAIDFSRYRKRDIVFYALSGYKKQGR